MFPLSRTLSVVGLTTPGLLLTKEFKQPRLSLERNSTPLTIRQATFVAHRHTG